jgi:GH25 family lysozyme M1 (1,4-beta-N-acetylmuramidase)
MIHGVDVSHWNGAYPWNSGEQFGIAKATEGTFYKDDQFMHNWQTMHAKGILRGAYHFGHPGTSAVAQADYFVAYVKSFGLLPNDVLALDLEVNDGLAPAKVAAWAVQFVKQVEKLTGKNVWVYTDGAFVANGSCSGLATSPLWIANPSGTAGHVTVSIGAWPVWAVQQYAFGTGGKPDLDVLNGDAQVWEQLANLVPAVKYKTVTGKWVCEGMSSLTQLCAGKFGNTAAGGVGASTVLRLTLDNSPDKLFANDLAAYITAGDLAKTAVPKGVVLYYPKRVKV